MKSKHFVYKYKEGQIINELLLLEKTVLIRTKGEITYENKAYKCKLLYNDKIVTYREDYITTLFKKPRNHHKAMTTTESALNRLIRGYTRHAKRRNLIWKLTFSQVKDLTQQNCYYCKQIPLQIMYSTEKKVDPYYYNGIDRKNNKIGYAIENCVPCCGRCNSAKSDMSINEFKNWIKALMDNYEKIN